ncbi:MAG: serine protease Do [Kiritimatiellia bacterium]|jgi:serine protease Do
MIYYRAGFVLLSFLATLAAAESSTNKTSTVEVLAAEKRNSIVLIKGADRWGESSGLGTGFVVGTNGVIASNWHVIGQNRAFTVQFPDGQTYKPTHVLGVDRNRDLALIKIDAKDLIPIVLGDSDAVTVGQSIMAIGNPLGLEFSVSRGVIAAERDLDGFDMIQVAIPLEPGSSGSPVMDLQGRALGLLAIKSSAAMGLAVPINDLKRLMENQRPMEMKHWITIGALDTEEWKSVMGGEWRQRAGTVVASGQGSGFGGRMQLLNLVESPGEAFELEVEVKLDEESGAAGLSFCSDGSNTHYGFYPTAESIRLTRFEGPDVYSWTILDTVKSSAYRPGEWNRLKVQVGDGKIIGSVNGEVAITANELALKPGQVGLVKFRAPGAEYRKFRVGDSLKTLALPEKEVRRVRKLLRDVSLEGPFDRTRTESLAAYGKAGLRLVEDEARLLEAKSQRLKKWATRVHQDMVAQELVALLKTEDAEIDLLSCALQIARLDNPELDMSVYQRRINRMVEAVKNRWGKDDSEEERLDKLLKYLFEDLGYHGSGREYYHRSNSYINEVIDDREGLPITLSLVLIEMADRLDLPVVGVGVPRHFICMYQPKEALADGSRQRLIDPFDGGQTITRLEASLLSGYSLDDDHFEPAGRGSIILRMLSNLLSVAEGERDMESMLCYLSVMLAIEQDPGRLSMRAMLYFSEERYPEALQDLDQIIELDPEGVSLDPIYRLREAVQERIEQE